ncbi:zinc carboxypeptidase-like [Onthophagus taurus]|uniref:zinc carboxypeptidase-like n=1 Tax=Onthophagus taurus TaxID=166361 RepID=UPI0039BE81D4
MNIYIWMLTIGVVCASQVRYDNFKVHRVFPKSEDDVEALTKLQENPSYDFWTDGVGLNYTVDIMVPPHLEFNFKDFLCLKNLKSEVYIENVQNLIDKERPSNKRADGPRSMGWLEYYELDEIYDWLDQLAVDHSDVVKVLTPGTSYEDRDIKGLHISYSANNEDNTIYIEGGIHAREWISSAVVTYIINEIITSEDPEVRRVVEQYDWYIFPLYNPDGFHYTKTTNRMWRKTRVPYDNCYGADPNRNFDYRWNTRNGASNNPCSETYAGPYPNSEREIATMSEFVDKIHDRLVAYFSIHSYGQLLLLPFGHTKDHLGNYNELKEVGTIGMEKLKTYYGTEYRVGNTAEILYVATGTSTDWVKATYGTRISYTYELRDTGSYGFILPPDQVLPSGIETFGSLVTILDEFAKR